VAQGIALALLGLCLGTAAVLTHGRPDGLALGVLASAATAWALPGGWTTRFAFTTGWIAVLAYALVPRGAGGYLIGSDPRGYLLLGFGLALMLVGIITVRPLRPRRPVEPVETTDP
jgi:hypothetical protein